MYLKHLLLLAAFVLSSCDTVATEIANSSSSNISDSSNSSVISSGAMSSNLSSHIDATSSTADTNNSDVGSSSDSSDDTTQPSSSIIDHVTESSSSQIPMSYDTSVLDSASNTFVQKLATLQNILGSATGYCNEEDLGCITAYEEFIVAQNTYNAIVLESDFALSIVDRKTKSITEVTDSTIMVLDSNTHCNTQTVLWEVITDTTVGEYYTLDNNILGLTNYYDDCEMKSYTGPTGSLYGDWESNGSIDNPYNENMCPQFSPPPPYYLFATSPSKISSTVITHIAEDRIEDVFTVNYNCFLEDTKPKAYIMARDSGITFIEESCTKRSYRDSVGRISTQELHLNGELSQVTLTEKLNNLECSLTTEWQDIFGINSPPYRPEIDCHIETEPAIFGIGSEHAVYQRCIKELEAQWFMAIFTE